MSVVYIVPKPAQSNDRDLFLIMKKTFSYRENDLYPKINITARRTHLPESEKEVSVIAEGRLTSNSLTFLGETLQAVKMFQNVQTFSQSYKEFNREGHMYSFKRCLKYLELYSRMGQHKN